MLKNKKLFSLPWKLAVISTARNESFKSPQSVKV